MPSASIDAQPGLSYASDFTSQRQSALRAILDAQRHAKRQPPFNGEKPMQTMKATATTTTTATSKSGDSVEVPSPTLPTPSIATASDLGHTQEESPSSENNDYDFMSDPNFGYDLTNDFLSPDNTMEGDLSHGSEFAEADVRETKRGHPDDDDDDDDATEGRRSGKSAKKRESLDKIPKKPGRKLLTSEPTTKRKAQNRAAQRAFRDRKERHLKDLETKIEDLEKASENVNHENEKLRAQVRAMTAELNDYKRKLSLGSYDSAATSRINDINFQFDFPTFGTAPRLPAQTTNNTKYPLPPSLPQNSSQTSDTRLVNGPLTTSAASRNNSNKSPSVNVNLANMSFSFATPFHLGIDQNLSTGVLDSDHANTTRPAAESSPSTTSHHSNTGISSSCGTSPESSTQSPMSSSKPADTMKTKTFGEEQFGFDTMQAPGHFFTADIDGQSFDWLARQNGGQFDPQLFGNLRDPAEKTAFDNTVFDDNFLNDLDADFFTPYFVAPTTQQAFESEHQKPHVAKTKVNVDAEPLVECPLAWSKIVNSTKYQNGEVDIDSLCEELKLKATCKILDPNEAKITTDAIVDKYLVDMNDHQVAGSMTNDRPTETAITQVIAE